MKRNRIQEIREPVPPPPSKPPLYCPRCHGPFCASPWDDEASCFCCGEIVFLAARLHHEASAS